MGSHLNPVAKQKISRFGTVLDMDLDAFSSALTQAESSYCADTDQSPINYSVRQFAPSDNHVLFEDRFIFDLFLRGDIGPEFVWQSLHGHLHYFIESPVAITALSSLENGYRAAAVFSDLGNGKSAVMEVLKVKAFDAGYDVYEVVINSDTLLEELQAVFRSSRKTLLVIEHYANWLDAIDFIQKCAKELFVCLFGSDVHP